jgi:hypothetical protein
MVCNTFYISKRRRIHFTFKKYNTYYNNKPVHKHWRRYRQRKNGLNLDCSVLHANGWGLKYPSRLLDSMRPLGEAVTLTLIQWIVRWPQIRSLDDLRIAIWPSILRVWEGLRIAMLFNAREGLRIAMLLNAMQNPADCCSMQEKVWELQCCWTQCKILLIVKWMMLVKNNIIHFHCSMLPCINSVHLITKSRSRRTAQNWRISRWYNHLGHNADYFMAVYGNFAMNHNINRQRKHNMNNVKKVFMKAVRG